MPGQKLKESEIFPEEISPPTSTNPNYCHRPSKNGGECGGVIFVQNWHLDDNDNPTKAIVISKCGRCESTEEDIFQIPKLKHSERCLQGQKLGLTPMIYLATCVTDVVIWKCGGCIQQIEGGRGIQYSCDAIDSKSGGFPF
jgi:hypothetical protein